MTIITSTYRYKPPPKRKRRRLAPITGPRIVTPADPKKLRRPATRRKAAPQSANDDGEPAATLLATRSSPSNRSAIVTVRDRKTREQQQMAKLMESGLGLETKARVSRSAIVTARKPGKAIPDGLLPDTPEERDRRADAADALWRELVRRVRDGG